ncbi:fungal-specific transcription factor domain-containing protein [Aspergillus karnatakaensis]|uniref:transcription factor domain-containing protein n=1 Tax=Aspergillus karnatakaensis TaxID=1810916 RepID=UPI003CCCBC34
MAELADLTNSDLRLGGVACRKLRFLIHRCQRTLVAVPGHGVPILHHLLPLTVRLKGVLDALLTLSDRLRLSDAQIQQSHLHRDGSVGFLDTSQPNMLDSYQTSLSALQASLRSTQSGLQDAEEAVAMSIILLIFGFPGDRIWPVHLNGLIALIQDPDVPALTSPGLSSLASHFAAHADIKAFSLGRSGASQRLWLNWRMHPLEQNLYSEIEAIHLSEFEISTGYPPSLVTVMAVISALIEDVQAGRPLQGAIDLYLGNPPHNQQKIYHPLSDGASERSPKSTSSDSHANTILEAELMIAQWRPPHHVEALPLKISMALTTAWAVMKKAAFIYLWRRGFNTDMRAALPPEEKGRIGQCLREALAETELVLQAAEKDNIMVANAMLWPLTVLGNECLWYPNLQARVLQYFQRLNNHCPIHHSYIVTALLQKLWKAAEETPGEPDSLPFGVLNLQHLAQQDDACIPLL